MAIPGLLSLFSSIQQLRYKKCTTKMVYDQSFTVATVNRSLAPVDRNGEIVRHSTSSLIKRDVIVCSLSFVQQAHIIRKKQRIITLQTDHIQIRSKQNRERNDQINIIYKKKFCSTGELTCLVNRNFIETWTLWKMAGNWIPSTDLWC